MARKKWKAFFCGAKLRIFITLKKNWLCSKQRRNLNSSIMSNYVKRKAISPMSSKTQIHFSTPNSSAVKEAKHYMQTSRKRNWLCHFKKRFQTKSFNNWKKTGGNCLIYNCSRMPRSQMSTMVYCLKTLSPHPQPSPAIQFRCAFLNNTLICLSGQQEKCFQISNFNNC